MLWGGDSMIEQIFTGLGIIVGAIVDEIEKKK